MNGDSAYQNKAASTAEYNPVGTAASLKPWLGMDKEQPVAHLSLKDLSHTNCIELFDQILHQAVNRRASDIHVECRENDVRLRFRIDGMMYQVSELPHTIHPQLISRIKIVAGMDIAEKRLPQDGRFTFAGQYGKVDCRVSTMPAIQGEKAVIRVLDHSQAITRMEDLGFSDINLQYLKKLSQRSHGLVLATGPTGSGKTSTLYALLNNINTVHKNIITLEDPVEYSLENINQVQINSKAGLCFANGLRSALRQDPDVIMVGEIRDEETAQLALHAALTGHLVLSTLHTNSAAAAVTRLLDMGCASYLLASALVGIISQRLVRLLCPLCQQSYQLSAPQAAWLNRLDLNGTVMYKPMGCSQCYGLGYMGRTAIQEVMLINAALKKAVYKGDSSEDELEALAVENHMVPLQRDGINKAAQGLSSLEEILRVVNEDKGEKEP
jgi:type IV pilus assembly protein PilB